MPSDFLTPFLELEEEFCKVSQSGTTENKNTSDFPPKSLQVSRMYPKLD